MATVELIPQKEPVQDWLKRVAVWLVLITATVMFWGYAVKLMLAVL